MVVIPQRLSIVTLGVESLRKAKRFYLEGLGWSQVDQPSNDVVFIQMPAMVLALYPHHALAENIGASTATRSGGYQGMTLAYTTNGRDETDHVLAAAVEAGAVLLKAGQETGTGGYSGYFSDPDGHVWEVVHHPIAEPGFDGSFWMD